MLVRQIMAAELVVLASGTLCRDAYRLFRKERIRRAPVVASGRLIGIVSERDLLRAMPGLCADADGPSGDLWERRTVEEVMTASVETLSPDDSVEEAARRMMEGHFGGLPVVDLRGRPGGMVTTTDLLAVVANAGSCQTWTRITLEGRGDGDLSPILDIARDLGLELVELLRHAGEGDAGTATLGLSGVDGSSADRLVASAWDSGWRVLDVRFPLREKAGA